MNRNSTRISWAALVLAIGASAGLQSRSLDVDRGAAHFAAPQALAPEVGRGLASVSLSLDGRFVAFVSDARLVGEDTNAFPDIYVLDRETSAVTLESVASDGTPSNDASRGPALSGDGRFLVFESDATDLDVRPDRNQWPDVFLRDRQLRTTRRVSVAHSGDETDGPSTTASISADARWIAFTSAATNLTPDRDVNQGFDVFLAEVATGTLSLASVSPDGSHPSTGFSFGARLSGDGALLAFVSTADFGSADPACPPAPPHGNRPTHVYARNNRQGTLACADASLASRSGKGRAYSPSISPDGGFVAFVFDAAGEGRGNVSQVYLHDLARSATTLVSHTKGGGPANGGSTRPAISSEGRFVAFESLASNLECGRRCPAQASDLNLLPDIYLADMTAGGVSRLSIGGTAGEWWVPSVVPGIDGSGRIVAFSSRQPRTPDDVDTLFDLYVWANGETRP